MDDSNNENQNKPNNTHLKHLFDIEDDEVFLHRKNYFKKIQNEYWKNITPANDNKRGENV